ncbi:hypothetical protein HDE_12722 [Halotydeus destructor]|nr:hypothetical protein HDE_12722 [Halotydeus destructor]
MSTKSLSVLNDDIIFRILYHSDSIWELFHFEATSVRFNSLAGLHMKRMDDVDLRSPSLKKANQNDLRRAISLKFGHRLKRIQLAHTWDSMFKDLHKVQPQLFPQKLLALCKEVNDAMEESRTGLFLVGYEKLFEPWSFYTEMASARNRVTGETIIGCQDTFGTESFQLKKYLDVLRKHSDTHDVKEELVPIKKLVLKINARHAYHKYHVNIVDVLKEALFWFRNVENVKLIVEPSICINPETASGLHTLVLDSKIHMESLD